MIMVSRSPSAALAPFVESLWYCEHDLAHAAECVLPSGQMQLLIRLDDSPSQIAPMVMTGPKTEPIVVETRLMNRLAGVVFRIGGAFPFLSIPCTELTNTDLDLSDLWGRGCLLVREKLVHAGSPNRVLRLLESILVERIDQAAWDPFIAFAARQLEGHRMVRDALATCGLSRGTFLRRFRKSTGLSPKHFAELRRFQRAVALLSGGATDLARVALESGYYDQAHFNHRFRRFAGRSPGSYRPLSAVGRNHVRL